MKDRKTTGPQLGLLGPRYDGPIAGRKSGTLFGDVSRDCPGRTEREPAIAAQDRLLAKKFAHCKSGDLYV